MGRAEPCDGLELEDCDRCLPIPPVDMLWSSVVKRWSVGCGPQLSWPKIRPQGLWGGRLPEIEGERYETLCISGTVGASTYLNMRGYPVKSQPARGEPPDDQRPEALLAPSPHVLCCELRTQRAAAPRCMQPRLGDSRDGEEEQQEAASTARRKEAREGTKGPAGDGSVKAGTPRRNLMRSDSELGG